MSDRPPYFSAKFIRLMTRCAAAQELGPNVCWLLTVIAGQEDAPSVRYRRPVTFYFDQLMPLCGFRSRKQLRAAITAAVDAGWLEYRPGAKSRPGKFRVLIPTEVADVAADGCDESGSPKCSSESEPEIDRHQNAVPNRNRKRTESAPQMHRKGNTFIPVPNPDPKRTATAVAAANGKSGKSKKKTKARAYSDEFGRFWSVYWNKTNKADAARAFPDALERIIDDPSLPPDGDEAAVSWLVNRTRDYARLRDETTDKLHPATYLNKDRFNDELGGTTKEPRTVRFNDEDSL